VSAAVPVAIVGAGACGLVAALTLKDAGVACVVLERDRLPSGSTALSSGFIPACGTRWQEALGIEDSVVRFAADIQHKNHGGADAAVVNAACTAIGPTLEWLADRHGIPFHVLQGFLYPGHSVARMHAVPEKTGAALMGRLLAAAQRAGIDLLTEARAIELHTGTGRRVTGLRIERPDGSAESIDCGAVLLACNGFGGNREMVRRYLPEIADAEYAGHAGNQGDAMRWGAALGARLADMTAYQGHGAWAIPHAKLVTWALMTEGGIQVNALGLRFADEHRGYSEASQPVLAQPGRFAWCVYDERLHRLGLTFPEYAELDAAGAVRRAASVEELARLLALPPDALGRTLEEVRAMQRGERADPFGRDFTAKPPLEAPWRAVKVTGALFHTQGGLEIDPRARVLDAAGRPLAKLFAAGGAARGLSGARVWGYLSGNGLLSAVALGRIAAHSLAADLEPDGGTR
jgi:fumarate reductase flavoprotein subunit